MARSHESYSDGEAVLYESRLHWVALFKEILFTALALGILLWFLLGWQPAGWIYWILLGGWAISCFRGVSNWFTTTVTLTNRRLIVRRGLLSKAGWELPVDRVLDVAFRQSLLQRMVGSGDLLVESAANTDRNTLHNVVRPTEVKRLISEARESVEERRAGRVSSAGTGPSRAEQLETLSRLHQQESLTDAEFEAEKQRLLAQG